MTEDKLKENFTSTSFDSLSSSLHPDPVVDLFSRLGEEGDQDLPFDEGTYDQNETPSLTIKQGAGKEDVLKAISTSLYSPSSFQEQPPQLLTMLKMKLPLAPSTLLKKPPPQVLMQPSPLQLALSSSMQLQQPPPELPLHLLFFAHNEKTISKLLQTEAVEAKIEIMQFVHAFVLSNLFIHLDMHFEKAMEKSKKLPSGNVRLAEIVQLFRRRGRLRPAHHLPSEQITFQPPLLSPSTDLPVRQSPRALLELFELPEAPNSVLSSRTQPPTLLSGHSSKHPIAATRAHCCCSQFQQGSPTILQQEYS